jgi:hypothetical protein
MFENLFRCEGGAMASDEEEDFRKALSGLFRKIDDLGNVRKGVETEADSAGMPLIENLKIIFMGKDLQVEKTHVVSGPARGLGDQLHAEGLETKVDFRIHQSAGMAAEDFHAASPGRFTSRSPNKKVHQAFPPIKGFCSLNDRNATLKSGASRCGDWRGAF